ncbi:DUF6779 domain-containing protein [Gordonia sp. SL306]|uniref:DUF6779 domain-containing protein n=1 Tax=Gordonia sp. SL306 TaxID=2995145 RepID=UPI00226E0A76|nr:DUF6779 domain-containing protein [Gordonia sp. SL306]WAC56932.1 hypothetical protein OVA31_06720 [Gordonia sp. SL306]
MTTSNGRSTESRRSGRSVGQWLLGLLIVLALVASILMVFTDQLSVSGSLAVIAALWAAVIGAILVTKFRRQAETAESKSRDLRLVYELQLEREIAARRQYELDVETTIRKEVSAESNEELAELKQQVLALRSSLEMLLGESLPEQRTALPNEKLRELASGIGGERPSTSSTYGQRFGTDDSVLAARDFAATAPAAGAGRHVPADVDPNEMTEVIPVITDDDPMSGRIATEVPEDTIDEQVEDAVLAEPEDVGSPSTGSFFTTSAPTPSSPTPTGYVDETPTDEWKVAARSGAPVDPDDVAVDAEETIVADAAPAERPVTETPVTETPVTETPAADEPQAVGEQVVEEETSGEAASTTSGRHESSGESSSPVLQQGRRRRRDDDDGDSAHSAGLPVSELLSQLRQSGSPGGGRRRRED